MRRKLLTFLIALASIVFAVGSPASADSCSRAFGRQGGTGCNSVITASGGGGSPTWTAQTSAVNLSCGSIATCAVPSVTVPTGFVVFAVSLINTGASSATFTSLALSGGCTGTLTLAQTNTIPASGVGSALFYGTVAGGTCTVTITATGGTPSIAAAGVALGLLSNLSSTTPGTGCQMQVSTYSGPPFVCSGSITVPSGGFGICAIGYNNATAMAPTNTTIDSQQNNTGFSNGIGETTVTEVPSFGGAAVVYAGIACAPWR
jgi:hypothetical protein